MAENNNPILKSFINLNTEDSEVVDAISNPIIDSSDESVNGDFVKEEFNAERFAAELSRLNKEYQAADNSSYNQGVRDILAEIIYEFHCDLGQPEEEVQD